MKTLIQSFASLKWGHKKNFFHFTPDFQIVKNIYRQWRKPSTSDQTLNSKSRTVNCTWNHYIFSAFRGQHYCERLTDGMQIFQCPPQATEKSHELQEAVSFFRSWQTDNYTRNSQSFMEAEVSLPCSQQPTAGPEPGESSPHRHNIFPLLIHFNIILSSTPRLLKYSLPFWFADYSFVCIFSHSHACYTSRPSHPPWFDHFSISEEYKLWISSLFNFLHFHVTSFSSGTNVLLIILFSNKIDANLLEWKTSFIRSSSA
jgi:hypothetical protein